MRKLFLMLALISSSLSSACGGGGGGEGAPAPAQPAATATLRLSVSGMLPAGTTIAGIDVTVALPSGVTVKSTTAPLTESGVVLASGLAGPDASIIGTYTPAAGTAPAAVRVLLADANGFAAGEFATVNCDVADGSSPKTTDFIVQASEVKDLNGAMIPGMAATAAATLE